MGAGASAPPHMSHRYMPVALQTLVLGQPAPVDLWNEQGILLLARGHVIQSVEHLRRLAAHRPLVRVEDLDAWQARLDGSAPLLRPGVVPPPSPQPPADARSPGLRLPAPDQWRQVARQDRIDPLELWPRLHRVLGAVLQHPQACSDFGAYLELLVLNLQRLVRQHPDDSLFLLLQMLQDRTLPYSTGHALLAATVCQLACDLPETALDPAVVPAALTMNLAMHDLHNQLASQPMPPDDEQRRRIRAHPGDAVARLRELGIRDDAWLRLVQDHHESPDGRGYPDGSTELSRSQRLLSMVDRFVAGVSPRAHRLALSPLVALRRLYDQADPEVKALGELLIRRIGLYPPGSYVRLANGESAVVVRRGPDARQPLVMALMNPQNIALPVPVLRYTGRPGCAVVAALPPDAVRVRFDPARLLRKA